MTTPLELLLIRTHISFRIKMDVSLKYINFSFNGLCVIKNNTSLKAVPFFSEIIKSVDFIFETGLTHTNIHLIIFVRVQ